MGTAGVGVDDRLGEGGGEGTFTGAGVGRGVVAGVGAGVGAGEEREIGGDDGALLLAGEEGREGRSVAGGGEEGGEEGVGVDAEVIAALLYLGVCVCSGLRLVVSYC
jgi:hypothetical protein